MKPLLRLILSTVCAFSSHALAGEFYAAEYEVPLASQNEKLKKSSTFEIPTQNITFSSSENEYSIGYALPTSLVGDTYQTIRLRIDRSSGELKNFDNKIVKKAECTDLSDAVTCDIVYDETNLLVDSESRNLAIANSFSSAEAPLRLAVAHLFVENGDPVGVLILRKK